MAEFEVSEAGSYTITTDTSVPTEAIISESPLSSWRGAIVWVVIGAVGTVLAVVGFVMLILGIVRRNRASKASRSPVFSPPPPPPPPPAT